MYMLELSRELNQNAKEKISIPFLTMSLTSKEILEQVKTLAVPQFPDL